MSVSKTEFQSSNSFVMQDKIPIFTYFAGESTWKMDFTSILTYVKDCPKTLNG